MQLILYCFLDTIYKVEQALQLRIISSTSSLSLITKDLSRFLLCPMSSVTNSRFFFTHPLLLFLMISICTELAEEGFAHLWHGNSQMHACNNSCIQEVIVSVIFITAFHYWHSPTHNRSCLEKRRKRKMSQALQSTLPIKRQKYSLEVKQLVKQIGCWPAGSCGSLGPRRVRWRPAGAPALNKGYKSWWPR